MTTRIASYIDAVAMLAFPQVTWDEYEELLEYLGDRPGLRVSYDEGRLEM